jgi:hypothetical protein
MDRALSRPGRTPVGRNSVGGQEIDRCGTVRTWRGIDPQEFGAIEQSLRHTASNLLEDNRSAASGADNQPLLDATRWRAPCQTDFDWISPSTLPTQPA